jgi:hypothetical protein
LDSYSIFDDFIYLKDMKLATILINNKCTLTVGQEIGVVISMVNAPIHITLGYSRKSVQAGVQDPSHSLESSCGALSDGTMA